MSFTNDGPSNFDHIGGTLSGIQKFIDDLKSEVQEKEQKIRELEDKLKKHSSPGLPIQNSPFWKEFRDGLEKVINEYMNKTLSQTSHISQSSESIEANQAFSTMESEEHAGSSSTSINHTGNLSFQYPNHITSHLNHESAESEFNRPNDFHNSYEEYSDSKQVQMHMPIPTLPSPQRRFLPNGANGLNNNYHNNNNNNRNNNNNNNNNRKKNTVFVSWTGRMERSDLENLFDRNDVTDIRYTPHKQFAHFDFRTSDAMNKALTYNKRIMDPAHGTLRVEAGKPRSNNNTENNNNNNNNNNNGQRPQNKNYNNRLQNKQNGGISGGYQKPYNKYQPNGISSFSNNHNNVDDTNDTPILSNPGIQMPNSESNL